MDFAVDLARLKELGSNLSTCGDSLEGALSALEEPGEAPLGTGVLDEACVEYQETWHTGLERIRECTDKLVEGVDASQRTYAALEAGLGQAFTRLAGQLGTPPQNGAEG